MQPHADPGYRLTDEDTEALLSLHNTFQKCVVRFSLVSLVLFPSAAKTFFFLLVSVLLHFPSSLLAGVVSVYNKQGCCVLYECHGQGFGQCSVNLNFSLVPNGCYNVKQDFCSLKNCSTRNALMLCIGLLILVWKLLS